MELLTIFSSIVPWIGAIVFCLFNFYMATNKVRFWEDRANEQVQVTAQIAAQRDYYNRVIKYMIEQNRVLYLTHPDPHIREITKDVLSGKITTNYLPRTGRKRTK